MRSSDCWVLGAAPFLKVLIRSYGLGLNLWDRLSRQSYRLHTAVAGVHSFLFVRLNEHFLSLSPFYIFWEYHTTTSPITQEITIRTGRWHYIKFESICTAKGTRGRRQHRMETFSSSAKDYQSEYLNSREKLNTKGISKSVNKLAN